MKPPTTRSAFASEASWPFTLHVPELTRCRDFLVKPGLGPRVVRIFGSSGTGKSFLVRELMTQVARDQSDGLGLYVDVPPAELEASAFLDRIRGLLSERRVASRDAPSFVGKKAARAWTSTQRGTSAMATTYGYRVSRELADQIPVVGHGVKALLAQPLQVRTPATDGAAPMRFLMRRSRAKRVLLTIDNVQFLPFALREMLDTELRDAGPHLQLVLVERVHERARLDWAPPVPGAEWINLHLEKESAHDVVDLVRQILPETDGVDELGTTIFRRSDGNLKSVWFQLRLIASRREDQHARPTSYEDVIQTLPALDQAVLRFIVFTVGGLTIATLATLLRATDLRAGPDVVTNAISDLASLGLLVVNGDRANRVRVEHELVAQVVTEITPEEEKLELRGQIVGALSAVLDQRAAPGDEAVLYDRLLGIVNEVELRQSPSLLSHVVDFIQIQNDLDRHAYLSSIFRDSVCWDVLDALPATTVRELLDAIQKSALLSFGLVATERLRRTPNHEALASLYEAKYLVQLFRYDEAALALARLGESNEKRAVAFNVMLALAQDDHAAEIAMGVYAEISQATGTEYDFVILRNSVHLFRPDEARVLIETAVAGFETLGRRFAVATALNNRGIVELAAGSPTSARASFEAARALLAELDSPDVYQPLVNLGGIALIDGDVDRARHLLSLARDTAPRALLQDSAMLDLNALALDVWAGDCSRIDAATRAAGIVGSARRTRDLRFIDIVTWFAARLGTDAVDGQPTAPSTHRVNEIRANGLVPLELFVPAQLDGADLEVPFVLSPHWRY